MNASSKSATPAAAYGVIPAQAEIQRLGIALDPSLRGDADRTVNSEVQRAWSILEGIADPEIPVVSIRELGILREVNERDGDLEVVITPTYSGCPAMGQIEDEVRAALAANGLHARVRTRLAPAWTTDWISEAGKRKLREFGIAPPRAASLDTVVRFAARRPAADPGVACPRCGSDNTSEVSHFSSTACKALYRCLDCREPFDYFKPY